MVANTTAAKEEFAKSYRVQAAMARMFTRRLRRARRSSRSRRWSRPRWRGRSRGGSGEHGLGHSLQQRLELRHDLATAREEMAAEVAIEEHRDEPPRVPPHLLHARRPRQSEESRGQEREQEDEEEPLAGHAPEAPGLEGPAHRIEHEADRDLVGRLHVGLRLEGTDDQRSDSVRSEEHTSEL